MEQNDVVAILVVVWRRASLLVVVSKTTDSNHMLREHDIKWLLVDAGSLGLNLLLFLRLVINDNDAWGKRE